ncbi:MAG: HTH domain-containing protein [Kiritimatiellae bacterium]|nr:HTH domain-containing protein [Kiritimatiellia bacterium]
MSGKILDLIREKPMISTSELAEKISVSERTVQRYVKVLQESADLVRVGSRKEGHWKVLS